MEHVSVTELWDLIKKCVYWVSEKQNDRFLEEANWFGLNTDSEDALYADLLNFEAGEGVKSFLDKNGFGIMEQELNNLFEIESSLDELKDLDNETEEKVYKVAVGMLYLLTDKEE